MNQTEVFNKIVSEHKWYVGKFSQPYASQLVARFHANQLKQKTIDDFLQLFGYVKVTEAEYTLQLEGKPSNLKTK